MRENTDQNNSVYGHFSRSVKTLNENQPLEDVLQKSSSATVLQLKTVKKIYAGVHLIVFIYI